MILDAQLEFSTAQDLTALTDVTDTISENVLDFGAKGDAYPDQHWVVVRVGTAFAGGTNLRIKVWTHTAATVLSGVALAVSKDILTAALTADTEVWKIKLPAGCKRYVGLSYRTDGDYTTGTVDAFLTPSAQDNDLSV